MRRLVETEAHVYLQGHWAISRQEVVNSVAATGCDPERGPGDVEMEGLDLYAEADQRSKARVLAEYFKESGG